MEEFFIQNPRVAFALLSFAFTTGVGLVVWLVRALGSSERTALVTAIEGLRGATHDLAESTGTLRDMIEAQNTRLARLEGEHAARRGGGCAA